MCGIAGFLSPHPDQQTLERMCAQLSHRGPDGCGAWLGDGVALGHRRLSIIDVAGGAQPLSNEDGTVWVTFNGEIYNYRELRANLLKKGHRFATRSDTEVLVHLYEEAGESMPEHLRGMFAFAIWDVRRRSLFLARDRLGEKPLYYSSTVAGLRFCFASELKALAVLPGFEKKIDPQALLDFLCLSYVPDPKSIYAGVQKLPPGHSLTVREGRQCLRRYWKPEFQEAKQNNFQDAVEELHALAQDAVRGQMISDVSLGAFLSGGVDSSSVVGLMADASSQPVRSFSIGFSDERYDERAYARLVSHRHQTQHRDQVVTPQITEILPQLARHYDEPFADSSAVPTLYLAKLARQQVTVALAGDGADEVFGGYSRYFHGVLEQRIRAIFPDRLRRPIFSSAAGCYSAARAVIPFPPKSFFTRMARDMAAAYFTTMSAFQDAEMRSILHPGLRASVADYFPSDLFKEKFRAVQHLTPLEQLQYVDLETYLPGDILVKTDRATMAYSLESRSPWLDHRLVELACRLPARFKLRRRCGKFIFKRAMSSFLPAEVVRRKKMGFSVPLGDWLRSDLRPVFETIALGTATADYFDLASVRRLWTEHQAGRVDHSRKLWTILVFGVWNRYHCRGEHAL